MNLNRIPYVTLMKDQAPNSIQIGCVCVFFRHEKKTFEINLNVSRDKCVGTVTKFGYFEHDPINHIRHSICVSECVHFFPFHVTQCASIW